MISHRTNRLPKCRLALVAVGVALGLAGVAEAGGKIISTGIMSAGNATLATTNCLILNLGTKPVTFASPVVYGGPLGQSSPPTTDTCTSTPLAPNTACSISRSESGVFGGATIVVAKGSPKNLRALCRLLDGSGTAVSTLPMS